MDFKLKSVCSVEALWGTYVCIYAKAKVPNSIFIDNKEEIYCKLFKIVLHVSEIAGKFGGIPINTQLTEIIPEPNQIIVSTYILFENLMQRLLFFNALSNEFKNGEYVN